MALGSCPRCGEDVPELTYCVRCGHMLASHPRRARGFAAAPHESPSIPHVVSTLFPHLPRSSLRGFRLALALAVFIVLVVGALGFYSIAAALSAAAVPTLLLVYLYDVDVYEDQPWLVIAFTAAWGAFIGLTAALALRAISPSAIEFGVDGTGGGVPELLIPVLAFLAAVLGPVVVLLPYRSFNDLLDGTTFGSVSACFANSAQVIALATPLFSEGLRPPGAPVPWLLLLGEVVIVIPLLWASLGGAFGGSFWFRFRAAPGIRSTRMLGTPLMEMLIAVSLLAAVGISRLALGAWTFLLLVTALLAVALARLRRLVHTGLVDEALETEIGPEVACPNCGGLTPSHLFCGECGIARRALPKGVGALPGVR